MNVGIYKGAAAMNAYERWQQAIAQNLASSSVNGYRGTEVAFQGVVGDVMKVKDAALSSRADAKGSMPDTTFGVNTAPGSLVHTGVDTNFAIQGDGFFRVRKPDGTVAYTRNGNFRMNADRTLVTQQGYEVEGAAGAIKFLPQGGAIQLNPQGGLIQGTQQVSSMTVHNFSRPGEMRRIGDGLMVPAPGDVPRQPDRPPIIQMVVEGSNVVPMQQMVNMVTVSRAYEMARKVVEVQDDVVNKTIQSLGNPVS
jgi:flagellar basal body rod protein FlgG